MIRVNELNLTFKKLVLLSVLTVLLGVSLVYAIGYEFKPKSSTQTGPTSSTFTPPGIAPLCSGHLLIFAYDGSNHSDGGSSFVQASVTITGPEFPITVPVFVGNGSTITKTFVNETLNGTTTTDQQSPLMFTVAPGQYSVFGTYSSAQPQNETVDVTPGSYCDAFLNFGSLPLPPLGHIIVTAWYTGNQSSGDSQTRLVQASVTITGPESHNGTTNDTDYYNPLMFTVAPGQYSVFGTYSSAQPQNETVDVTAGSYSAAVLIFGDAPWRPPP